MRGSLTVVSRRVLLSFFALDEDLLLLFFVFDEVLLLLFFVVDSRRVLSSFFAVDVVLLLLSFVLDDGLLSLFVVDEVLLLFPLAVDELELLFPLAVDELELVFFVVDSRRVLLSFWKSALVCPKVSKAAMDRIIAFLFIYPFFFIWLLLYLFSPVAVSSRPRLCLLPQRHTRS